MLFTDRDFQRALGAVTRWNAEDQLQAAAVHYQFAAPFIFGISANPNTAALA
jgi:hypothetical protein